MKISLPFTERLAKFILQQQHGTDSLDRERQIQLLGGNDAFLLKVFSTGNRLIRVYRVSWSSNLYDPEQQPFQLDIMEDFRQFKTDPPENYYCVIVRLDQQEQPVSLILFPMPMEFSRL